MAAWRAVGNLARVPGMATVRWIACVCLASILFAAAGWLWGVGFANYCLKLDDFVYVARSRTVSSLISNLFVPHNGHVVPLFLAETHVLCWLAGSLERLPTVLAAASYVSLVTAMAAVGHVVSWEAGRLDVGVAAMAVVGISTVLGPAVLWYSAGQALVCGTMVVVMLALLQAWRRYGWWWLMAAGLLAVAAAPLFWTAGYIAGPVGCVYLYLDGRAACRRVAVTPLVVSAGVAAAVWSVTVKGGMFIGSMGQVGRDEVVEIGWITRVWAAVSHSGQAICEALVLNNLGLDGKTEGWQAVLLVGLLLGAWVFLRGRGRRMEGGHPRLRPLEAAGLAMVLLTFGMIYAVRGTDTTFDNLRALGWYEAIPQLGLAVFVGGWLSGPVFTQRAWVLIAPGRRGLVGLLLFVGAFLILQSPRAGRVMFEYDGMAGDALPLDQHDRANDGAATLAERAADQRVALGKLDAVERAFRAGNLGGDEIERVVREIEIPGMPSGLEGFGITHLIVMPVEWR